MVQKFSVLCSVLYLLGPILSHSAIITPQVADAFYPSDPEALTRMIADFLARASTQGAHAEILGAIVPHAGYVYSGPTAAEVYRRLQGKHFDTVIILGTGHYYGIPGAAVISSGAFTTPLGAVPIDEAAAQKLLTQSPLIADFPSAFEKEHSIEVQLPFLQTVLKDFKIIPLVMNTNDPRVSRAIGSAIASICKPRKTLLLVSTDLSHYPDRQTSEIADRTTIEALLANNPDPGYFYTANRLVMERAPQGLVCTYCGEAALNTALYALKSFAPKARLLAYTNSGRLAKIGDPSRVVGYAALLWIRDRKPSKEKPLDLIRRRRLVQMARDALNSKLVKNQDPQPQLFDDPQFNQPAAVFVTLRRQNQPKETSLRGCIGSLVPDLPLGEAVQVYAIKSALEDHRFAPVTASELSGLAIEISRLTPFRQAASAKAVRSGHGVLLTQKGRSGLFLPSVWETLPDKNQFLGELCSQKAGLPRDCWKDPKTEIFLFDAEAFEE